MVTETLVSTPSIDIDNPLIKLAPTVAQLILSDDVCKTLSQNSVSKSYIGERIIEICSQALLQPDLKERYNLQSE